MAPNDLVDTVKPGLSSNPDNVKNVEIIFPESAFQNSFPNANSAYTYTNLLKAFAKFPEVCKTLELCKKTLATMFAHFEQETAGLFYVKEINRDYYCAEWSEWVKEAYPCTPGQKYYGRGAKQLSWNYNYGAFSQAIFGDVQVLLDSPDLVSDTWLNFASAIWFFVTPQPPKPSMLELADNSWQPNAHDIAEGRLPGFGVSIMVINGQYECGMYPTNPSASGNRQSAYKLFTSKFGVDISGEKLDCYVMQAFDAQGSFNPSIYWAPENGCRLANWQTAYSALLEGDYDRCTKDKNFRLRNPRNVLP